MSDRNAMLAPYRNWLYFMANQMSPTFAQVDDLAQEGYIAMWRSLEAYDPAKGSLPSWVTKAAKMRMSDVLRRGVYFGQPSQRGVLRVEDHAKIAAIEGMAPIDLDAMEQATAVWLNEGLALAYHRGAIHRALQGLPPEQQRYVVLRFWHGMSNPEIDPLVQGNVVHLWRLAKASLQQALLDLEAA